ncbi:MAG: hypothetical protein AABY10_00250, partial [Nanoarchaeota archaeon]
MNKRGQFFLIAALAIVGVIIGLTTVYNNISTVKEDFTVYDLSNEINYESAQVIDSGLFNSLDNSKIDENLKNLTDFYSKSNPDQEFVVLFGNEKKLKVVNYKKTPTGSIGVSFGGNAVVFNSQGLGSHEDERAIERCMKKEQTNCQSDVRLTLADG